MIAAQRMLLAESLFRENPDADPGDVNAEIARRTGAGLSGTNLYYVRRDVRSRVGVAPAPGTRAHNRLPPEVEATVEGALPLNVTQCQAALVEALRLAGVQSYALTFVGGEAECEYEMEVRRVARGRTAL